MFAVHKHAHHGGLTSFHSCKQILTLVSITTKNHHVAFGSLYRKV